MDIKEQDIDTITVIGRLNNSDVKLIRTKGGFNIAMGSSRTGSANTEPLAVGSHSAIVMHNLGKKFQGFQPLIKKSEMEESIKVQEMSDLLGADLVSKGYDLYFLEKNHTMDMSLTYQNVEVASFALLIKNDELKVSNFKINESKRTKKENYDISKALQEGLSKKAKELSLKINSTVLGK